MSILTDMGIGCPTGLSVSDKTRLVQIANDANSNNDSIRNNIINTLNTKFKTSLTLNNWNSIILFINNMNLGDATPSDVVKDKIFSSNSGITQKGIATIDSMGGYTPGEIITNDDLDNLDREGQINLLLTFYSTISPLNLLMIDDNRYGVSQYTGAYYYPLAIYNGSNLEIQYINDANYSIDKSIQMYNGVSIGSRFTLTSYEEHIDLLVGSNAIFSVYSNIFPEYFYLSQNKKNVLITTNESYRDDGDTESTSGYSIYTSNNLYVVINASVNQNGRQVFNHNPGILLGIDNDNNVYYIDPNSYTLFKMKGLTKELISQYNLSEYPILLDIDSENNIYIVYDSSQSIINKYDSNLNLIWSTNLNAPNHGISSHFIDLKNTFYLNYGNTIYKVYPDGTFSNIVLPYPINEFKLTLSEKYLFASCRYNTTNYIYIISNKSIYKLKLKDK